MIQQLKIKNSGVDFIMKKLIIPIIAIIATIGYLLIMKDFRHQENTIYFNGTVLTMEESQPLEEAVYVKNGIIKAVGSSEDIIKLKDENTNLVDLQSKTMLPGFIDPHTHPAISIFLHDMVDLSGFTHKTNKEVWDHLQKTVNKSQKGKWIICKGLDPILTENLKTPHISFLDKIAPENPLIILSQSLHSYWANTNAFKKAGISNTTPDPSTSSYYEKDSAGNLTGFIAEQEALTPFRKAWMKNISKRELFKTAEKVMKEYAKNGNTTIVSTGLTTKDGKALRLFEHMSSEEPSFLNQILALIGFFPDRIPMVRHFIYIRFDAAHLLPEVVGQLNYFFRIIGIKIWYDGSPYTGSMYLKEPYLNSNLTQKEFHIPAGHKGESLISRSELTEFIKKYASKNWQISVHTQGDQAITETLEAFEEAGKTIDIDSHRHRLEHCLLLDNYSIITMKRLNITPSIHINHLYYYGKALKESIIGNERAQRMLPIKSIADSNLQYSLHADQPMFESNPLHLIHTAVNRKTKEGIELGISEAISVHEAIRAMTIMAAWQIGLEDKLGSIKKGKFADFVILDQNPLEVKKSKIRDIRVLKTIINGNEVGI